MKKKLKANTKKIIVLCSMVALLVITGTLNFFLNNQLPTDDPNTTDPTQTTFFASQRSHRESVRAAEIANLDAIINNELADETAKTTAYEKKMKLIDFMETEVVIEGMIKGKGFEDAIVSMTDSGISIIVKHEGIKIEDAAQIYNIVVEQTDYTAAQITLTPYSA